MTTSTAITKRLHNLGDGDDDDDDDDNDDDGKMLFSVCFVP